jgi:hypothetical protein
MESEKAVFYRFPLSVENEDGKPVPVGVAFHREGHRVWSLKLWTFPTLKFFLMRDKEDPSVILIFTREERRQLKAGKGKYYWNLIGRGASDVKAELVRLNFDLFEKTVLMSLYPTETHAPPIEFDELMEVS